MRYISLFSGIGGFEIAIHNIFPHAECIGFSEVDKFAIQVYKHHFLNHQNLGDVTNITEQQIKRLVEADGCDLIVGGFPCQNLSSLARMSKYGNSNGLKGPKSKLFYNMIQVIEWVNKYNVCKLHVVIENNASMKNEFKQMISETLQSCFEYPVYMTQLNGEDFGVQKRKRLYWTTFIIENNVINCNQTWKDVLLPIEQCNEIATKKGIEKGNNLFKSKHDKAIVVKKHKDFYKFRTLKNKTKSESRWVRNYHSDTINEKSSTVNTARIIDNYLIDRRFGGKDQDIFMVRHLEPVEVERLFFIPDGWVSEL